jgi:SAM-dependent methyltransferase
MSEVAGLPVAEHTNRGKPKDKSCLLGVISRYLETCSVDRSQPVLVVGGGREDLEILTACGFTDIVLSHLDAAGLSLDAEDIALPDDSYPLVFAHAMLHHCRSPHKAVGEMLRVAQQHVVFVEPNDSAALRLLVRAGFSFPYELGAVVSQDYLHGGLRDGPVPNYIYRWTGREVSKCAAAYHPERQIEVRAHPFWDFYVNEFELLGRKKSHVAKLAQMLGPSNFIHLLHIGQAILNVFSPLRSQGNKFFCIVSKKELQPWIETREGSYFLRKED